MTDKKLESWISHVVSSTMFILNSVYFMSNLDKSTFLHKDIAQFFNAFGFALSLMCLFVTFFSALAKSGLFDGWKEDFIKEWVAMEQRIRDTSLLVLFALVSFGSGMNTSDSFAVVSMVSIFVGRQTSKYFDLREVLDDSDYGEKPASKVTWVQNGLALLMFGTACIWEIIEGTKVDLIDYIIGIAAVVQFVLLVSKRISQELNERRVVFEETVCSVFHFIVLGSLLSRVNKTNQLISVAAVIVADASARVQRKLEPVYGGELSDSTSGEGWNLFITRVVSTIISLTVAGGSIVLFEENLSVKDTTLATLAMVAGVLKALNCIAFLLDSRKEAYKSVYNFINNGTTSLLLVSSSLILAPSIEDPRGMTVLLFSMAIASRIVDMVQNAYATGAGEARDEILSSSMVSRSPLERASYSNFRTWIIFLMLVGSGLYAYLGIGDLCTDFITTDSYNTANCTLTEVDAGVSRSYFFIVCIHVLALVIAFIVSRVNRDEDKADGRIAVSTMELIRVCVSTAIIILGSFVLGMNSSNNLVLSFTFYLLSDGLGMSHA